MEGPELLKKCEGRLLRKYVPEGKLKRIQHQENKFANGILPSLPPLPLLVFFFFSFPFIFFSLSYLLFSSSLFV